MNRPLRSMASGMLASMRPHQWTKSALLVVPALAAHHPWSLNVAVSLSLAFLSFSASASALYLINDVLDVANDRAHPTKRFRPIAAGALPVPVAVTAALVLLCLAAGLATVLPVGFGITLAIYGVLSAMYSWSLKKRPALDVIALATLYTLRLVAGAAVVAVPLSRWFLAFSVFLFFSLAALKRVAELVEAMADEGLLMRGRGYLRDDASALVAVGISSATATALVYCLYVNGPEAALLYSRPDVLWFGLPLLLYWHLRVWIITGRDEMHEDPVRFALSDPTSYVVLALLVLTVLLAV